MPPSRTARARSRTGSWIVALATAVLLVATSGGGRAADSEASRAYEAGPTAVQSTQLDHILGWAQKKRGVQSADPCSDAVFVRRAYLDVIGALPEPAEVRAFLLDRRPNRRALLVDALMDRPEFADYWAMRWCDALRVKSEFPINLWPNAVQAYHKWVRDSIRDNLPYDRFARAMLTSSGSNFRDPPVNFWRAVQGRQPPSLAAAVALTFMGARFDAWPEDRRKGMAAFFSRVTWKKTMEWKEEIVLDDPAPAAGPVDAVFPDGTPVRVPVGADPRTVFADWLVRPENPWFARAVVNRMWAWIFGRGLVHEPDDMRPDNPAVVPEALDFLAKELVTSGWDLQHVQRLVFTSRTWQQSPIPAGDLARAEAVFACYPSRRLDAEVLIDALCWIGGTGETYTSTIPEPYTFIPEEQRTVALADGSISSAFLELFGRPSRDTGLFSERNDQMTESQRLWLLNSGDVQRRIERSPRFRALDGTRGNLGEYVRQVYLTVLSRYPTEGELSAANAYFVAGGRSPRESAADLAWALINTKEFLFRH